MSNYKRGIRITVIAVTAIFVGIIAGILLERGALRSIYDRQQQGDKLSWVMSLIDKKYVDSIARDSLAELAIPAILSELDPHSVYIPARDYAASNEQLAGSFEGIGVMFNMISDTVLVTNVISGGPSAKAGVVAGDMIITANDTLIAGVKMDQDKVVERLRGPRGTTVRLGVLRSPSKELLPIAVTRDVIPVKSLEAAFIVKPGVGYIRFGRFASTTYTEVLQALKILREQGAKKMILDLRGNSGGYLDPAIYITNEFLAKDQAIVYTEGNASPRVEQKADGRGQFQDMELAVIIDEFSASAAEIVAGAIQDNDRGVIIGRRSFGKGLVQEQFSFRDGSAIRLTIARYYTPVGRSIQKPYSPGNGKEYQEELLRRVAHQELAHADSIHQVDSLRFITPGGKVVYGGGGIMPDLFVPVDTTGLTLYFSKLFQKNLIFKYATLVVEQNRKAINAMQTMEQIEEFLTRRNLYYDFIAYADRQGVRPSEVEMTLSRALITAQLRGYIGRYTSLEDNAFYYYIFPLDVTLQCALERLEQPVQ